MSRMSALVTFSDKVLTHTYGLSQPTQRLSRFYCGIVVGSTIGGCGCGFYEGYRTSQTVRYNKINKMVLIGTGGLYGTWAGLAYGVFSPITIPISLITVGIVTISENLENENENKNENKNEKKNEKGKSRLW